MYTQSLMYYYTFTHFIQCYSFCLEPGTWISKEFFPSKLKDILIVCSYQAKTKSLTCQLSVHVITTNSILQMTWNPWLIFMECLVICCSKIQFRNKHDYPCQISMQPAVRQFEYPMKCMVLSLSSEMQHRIKVQNERPVYMFQYGNKILTGW